MALWLRDEVGEGNRFTKQDLRNAIPGVEQIDRRMRDLRPAGWVIRNYKDNPALQADELLLERIGLPVWEREFRSAGVRGVPDRTRRAVIERDGFRCVRCGAVAGEKYVDDPNREVQLSVRPVTRGAQVTEADPNELITECARCSDLGRSEDHLSDQELVWNEISRLTPEEQAQIFEWMMRDRRSDPTPVEIAWAKYRQLPPVLRGVLRRRLGRRVA